jgi:hypothetical protein
MEAMSKLGNRLGHRALRKTLEGQRPRFVVVVFFEGGSNAGPWPDRNKLAID